MKDDNQLTRVLIVDDEEAIAILLAEKLRAMDDDYIVETATHSDEVLEKVQQASYALVIADYMMPGLSGLDLVHILREISPVTRVVLMTAHPSSALRETVNYMGLGGYLNGYLEKPFSMEQVQAVIDRVLKDTEQGIDMPGGKILRESVGRTLSPAARQKLYKLLSELRANTKARCILLLNSNGYLLEVVGNTGQIDWSSVRTLVKADFTSSYHEGPNYNAYLHNLGNGMLLAVVLASKSKAGTVQFYTKQTTTKLMSILKQEDQSAEGEFDDRDAALEKLLSGDETSEESSEQKDIGI
jgi:DNA-binding response OmpR family regulator